MPRSGQQRLPVDKSPQLPWWTATRTGGKRFNVILTCGWCGADIPVNWKRLRATTPEYHTRSCLYCFKTGKLPVKENAWPG